MVERSTSHLWLPPLSLFAVVAASFVAYNNATPAIANVVIYVYGSSLVIGPTLVWMAMRRQDAPIATALAGAYLVPIVWVIKECIAVGRIFSIGEAIYYAFNPLVFGLFIAVALQLAVTELVLGRLRAGRWQFATGPALVIAAVLMMGAAYGVVVRSYGVTAAHYAYLSGYRAIFGD